MEKDRIFASELDEVSDFKFDERVAKVFPDMLKRSIPGYSTIISTIGILAARYAQANTSIYDLGCSLGAVSLSIQHRIQTTGCQIIAVDNSADMLKRAKDFVEAEEYPTPIALTLSDIADIDIQNASVVVLNFTLQFFKPEQRHAIISKIYQGLTEGGVLILSEKITFDSSDQQWMDDLHLDFKRANGYSELEISQKRVALENVMKPETDEVHFARLKQAGFKKNSQWYRCFNFASYISQK